MNAKIIIALQLAGLILMLGTAENLFNNLISTIIFTASLLLFIKCSIYISKNEKWLLRDCNATENK